MCQTGIKTETETRTKSQMMMVLMFAMSFWLRALSAFATLIFYLLFYRFYF
jgi:hypothetical protein